EPDTDRGNWLETVYVDATARLDYRNNITGLIVDAVKADPAIAAQLTLALQAMADTDPDDEPYARQIAETLLTRDGPDWKGVLAAKDHIVLNLWDELGRMLVAQLSELETTNRDVSSISELQ